MNEYNISDYGIFSDAVTTTKHLTEQMETSNTTIEKCKNTINNDTVFKGPICDKCIEAFENINSKMETITININTIGDYLKEASETYKSGDNQAQLKMLSIGGNGQGAISRVEIPNNIPQGGYTVTCYGTGGWYLNGGSTPTAISATSRQKRVHDQWLAGGAKYKNGIAVININGQDRYLIATTPTLGTVGDCVNVNLENGQTISCIVADAKSCGDTTYTQYGHDLKNGKINVLEFEVDRNKYNSTGNPKTDTWGLEWDSNSKVKSVDNYGSIIRQTQKV